jgi:hypothetical protein
MDRCVSTMTHKRIIPVVVLLTWMPFRSAHAEGEGAANPKPPASANGAGSAVVSFKTTLGMISSLYREKLEYEQALDLIQLARQRPLGTSELVTLSLYEGIILYEVGRYMESGDAFQMALLIRPDAKLPVQVAPKIAEYFETLRRRAQKEQESEVELAPPTSKPAPPPSGVCPPSRLIPRGRTLKAQQTWRVAMMEQMLCTRGIRGGTVAETLSALKAQVMAAGTSTEWMRLSQDLDRFAHQFGVYPSDADWHRAKSEVSEEFWEVGDEDQDAPLPEGPTASAPKSLPEQEPANLFGCRPEVAPDCERLMKRLLLLQNQTLDMEATTRSNARKELFRLGQRIREATSNAVLEEAVGDIDDWSAKWLSSRAG